MARRRLQEREGGFTLIEVMVALIIIGLVAAALVPLLVANSRASALAKMSTLAKNLNQQRIDAMRILPFHVDAQNGPYVDLLDLYFHNASSTVANIPDIVPGQTIPGQYVAAGGAGGPSGPYYQVTIPGGYFGSPYAAFTQTVYTQFLVATNPAATPLSASQIPATYDNSVVSKDSPASPLLGVTIITSWRAYGTSKSYSSFTEITDTGTGAPLLSNEADAIAFRIISQDYAGNALEARLGDVTLNGSLANGSQAAATAVGASVSQGQLASITGAQSTAVSPPNPSGGQGVNSTGSQAQLGSSNCGWTSFGPTQVSDVSATTAGGQPVAPSDTDGSATGAKVQAMLMSNGGGSCSGLRFSNTVEGSPAANPSLNLSSVAPMVHVQDQSGNTPEVTGSGAIWSVNQPGNPGAVVGRASTSMGTWAKVFPGLSFVPAAPGSYGITGYQGLVNIRLDSATLACSSTSAGASSATLSYSGSVAWYTQSAGWQMRSFSWTSGGVATDPLAFVDLTQPVNTSGTPLSAYITSLSGATSVTGGTGGVQSVEAAVSLATVPTLGASYPGTRLSLEFGHLACVAQDNRS